MESEQLTAVVQDTTFRNDENGYTVLRVTVGRTTQTVVGQMPELSPGENVTFEGSWTEHPRLRQAVSRSQMHHHPAYGQDRH